MFKNITHEPIDEKQLVDSKDHIFKAPSQVDELTELLKEVNRHYVLLEKFSFMYEEVDIEKYWYMRIWPLKIQACLTDSKNMIQEKNELFSARLDLEKETFVKQLT
jgi:hypothetical protein